MSRRTISTPWSSRDWRSWSAAACSAWRASGRSTVIVAVRPPPAPLRRRTCTLPSSAGYSSRFADATPPRWTASVDDRLHPLHLGRRDRARPPPRMRHRRDGGGLHRRRRGHRARIRGLGVRRSRRRRGGGLVGSLLVAPLAVLVAAVGVTVRCRLRPARSLGLPGRARVRLLAFTLGRGDGRTAGGCGAVADLGLGARRGRGGLRAGRSSHRARALQRGHGDLRLRRRSTVRCSGRLHTRLRHRLRALQRGDGGRRGGIAGGGRRRLALRHELDLGRGRRLRRGRDVRSGFGGLGRRAAGRGVSVVLRGVLLGDRTLRGVGLCFAAFRRCGPGLGFTLEDQVESCPGGPPGGAPPEGVTRGGPCVVWVIVRGVTLMWWSRAGRRTASCSSGWTWTSWARRRRWRRPSRAASTSRAAQRRAPALRRRGTPPRRPAPS